MKEEVNNIEEISEEEKINKIMEKENEKSISTNQIAYDKFCKILSPYLTSEEIKKTLINNGYYGLYFATKDEIYEFSGREDVVGLYKNEYGIGLLCEEAYDNENEIAIHELAHAFVNERINKKIQIDIEIANYGNGLEEGIVSIICQLEHNDIDKCKSEVYPYQARLFQQLNTLYCYNQNRKYRNLLEFAIKEPEKLIPEIKNIYESILINNNNLTTGQKKYLASKCAFNLILICDLMLDYNYEEQKYLYGIQDGINTLFLGMVDSDIRNGKKENELFPCCNLVVKDKEDRLLSAIFGNDEETRYFDKKIGAVYELLNNSQILVEYKETDKQKVKL